MLNVTAAQGPMFGSNQLVPLASLMMLFPKHLLPSDIFGTFKTKFLEN